MDKATIRLQVRERLKPLSASHWSAGSGEAVKRLVRERIWREARIVLGYLALKHELDLASALAAAQAENKTVALPRYVQEEQAYCAAAFPAGVGLSKGAFGIHEPGPGAPVIPLNQLDLVLVPGVAFDLQGRRLGRGKGFYDRLLAQVNGVKCGVALDEQIVEALPAEPHDIAVDYVLTPTRWLAVHSAPSAGT